MSMLMDSHTRLLALDLFHQEGGVLTLPAFITRLGTILGLSQPPLDVSELREALLTAAVESLLIVVIGAQDLSPTCFLRADQLIRSACQGTQCQVNWLLDDISMLGRLSLPTQANIALHRVAGRSADDTLIDIISGLLSHAQVLPSDQFLDELRARLEQGVSVPEMRLFLKLSLLEHFMGRPRTSDGFLKLTSVRQELEAMSNAGEETVGEIGMALAADAETALGKISWAWTVLTTIRSLWGEELCPAADLLRQPLAQAVFALSHWSLRILSRASNTSSATEGMKDLRQMQLFQRALVTRASDTSTTKELLATLPSTDLEAFLRALNDFVSSHLTMNVGPLLGEFCQLLPGPVTSKLLTPRLMEVLQMALEHPDFYQQGRLTSEPSEEASLPSDTSVVFRLAGECGKFINTHDWYISYRQSVDPKRSQEETSLLYALMCSIRRWWGASHVLIRCNV